MDEPTVRVIGTAACDAVAWSRTRVSPTDAVQTVAAPWTHSTDASSSWFAWLIAFRSRSNRPVAVRLPV